MDVAEKCLTEPGNTNLSDCRMVSGDDVSINEEFLSLEFDLCDQLAALSFSAPVTHVYNPLLYARNTHKDYVMKYLRGRKPVIFLGMNPGPYGMAQNGVPFGENNHVVNWLGIKGEVYKPNDENLKRQIHGLSCSRSEVSGARFWGYFKDVCKVPEVFFRYCFVHNYCPLMFMMENGKNITPADMNVQERKEMESICDKSLCQVISLLHTDTVVCIGKYVETRTRAALKNAGIGDVRVVSIMHPSPRNPKANQGWGTFVGKQLEEFGLLHYIQPPV